MKKVNIFGAETQNQTAPVAPAIKAVRLTQRMLLLEDRAEEVIHKLLNIATNDDHPKQMDAIRVVVDRMLPVSEFDKETKGGGIKTVFVDRSCAGKVTITTGGNSIQMDSEEFLTIEGEIK